MALSADDIYMINTRFSPAVVAKTQLGTAIGNLETAGAAATAGVAANTTALLQRKYLAVNTYSFAVSGGAVGAIVLPGHTLPANAIVVNSFYEVITPMASAGGAGTFALQLEAANDVVTAVDADTVSGIVQGIPDHATVGDWVKVTTAKAPSFVIAVEDLTAGLVHFYLEYVVSPSA